MTCRILSSRYKAENYSCLQTRSAKRSALAKLRTAVEMAEEDLISRTEALLRVGPADIEEVLSQQLDLSNDELQPIAKGLAASPGSAVGQLALTADRAVELAGKDKQSPIILVRQETNADDIHGMDAAVGFLTAHGGATSHAAVVARGMGKCCITGASGIFADEAAGVVRIGEHTLQRGRLAFARRLDRTCISWDSCVCARANPSTIHI